MYKPPYSITPEILRLTSEIAEKIGTINAAHLTKPSAMLRKENRIQTIQSSLAIEGNSMNVERITAYLDGKRVFAPEKDLIEVRNAVEVYNELAAFRAENIEDLKRAHGIMMRDLIKRPGKFRTSSVGVVKGDKVIHLAPGAEMVGGLMGDLFGYLKKSRDIDLIKSCVFLYEFEFIHPFTDGNGRMGRLWQTVILMRYHPVFEFLPVERLIKLRQQEYYRVLAQSDSLGESTPFIRFMLQVISDTLEEIIRMPRIPLTVSDRIELFRDIIGTHEFSRKDYMNHYKELSAPTASRDLREGTEQGVLEKTGDKRMTRYQFK